MGTQSRYCVNCKHYRKGRTFDCGHGVKSMQEVDRVSGKARILESGGNRASDERRFTSSHYCGPKARYYAEKRWRQRLILWTGI